MDYENIIQDVDRFLDQNKMAASTLGKKAVNDGKAIKRLRAGKRMWPETIEKLREFMASHQTPSCDPVAPNTQRVAQHEQS